MIKILFFCIPKNIDFDKAQRYNIKRLIYTLLMYLKKIIEQLDHDNLSIRVFSKKKIYTFFCHFVTYY